MTYTYKDYLVGSLSKAFVFTTKYGVISTNQVMNAIANVTRKAIIYYSGGIDETVDFGGNISRGGLEFDTVKLKRYILNILDDTDKYLRDPNGTIHYTLPYLAIASNVLKNRGRVEDSIKVMYAGMLFNSEEVAAKVNRVTKTRGRPTRINFRVTSFSDRVYDYYQKYMMHLTIPEGYTCYLYEPRNIMALVLLSTLSSMTTVEIATYLNNGNQGLLISEIDRQTENIVWNILLRNQVNLMNGYYGSQFRQKTDMAFQSDNTNNPAFLKDYLIPRMCQLMDANFFNAYLSDLAAKQITEADCFINYMTPKSIAVCIRNDLDINYILPSVASKFVKVGIFNMTDPYNYV